MGETDNREENIRGTYIGEENKRAKSFEMTWPGVPLCSSQKLLSLFLPFSAPWLL